MPAQALGTVRGRYRSALTVSWAHGGWGTVVERDGDDYPWGVRVAALPDGVVVGDTVVVADGSYLVGRHDIAASVLAPRASLPIVPGGKSLTAPSAVREAVTVLDRIDRLVLARFERLLDAVTVPAGALDAADALVELLTPLVGAGTGLTPFGDDVIVGALAGLTAIDPLAARPIPPPTGTSDLSSWFIEMAASGHVGRCLATVANATVLGDEPVRDEAVPRLISYGATSGLGMALGVSAVVAAHPSTSTNAPTRTNRMLPW